MAKKVHCRAFWIASFVHIMQQICGINGILLQLFNVGGQLEFDFDVVYFDMIGLVSAASIIFYFCCLRRISRKIPLVMGILIMASCQSSICSFNYDRNDHTYFTFILFCCFVAVFQATLGPIAWLQAHQILTPQRAALASSFNWIFNFLTTLLVKVAGKSPKMKQVSLGYASIFFSTSCFLGGIVLALFFPETNLKHRDQILQDLMGSVLNDKSSLIQGRSSLY